MSGRYQRGQQVKVVKALHGSRDVLARIGQVGEVVAKTDMNLCYVGTDQVRWRYRVLFSDGEDVYFYASELRKADTAA